MNPKVRQDLLLTDLEDELVIYDPSNFNGHNLNKTSKLVFEHCDGEHSTRDLAKMLEIKLGVKDGTDLAELALKQLNKKGLLEAESLPEAPTITRREVMKLAKMAGLAIAVLPVIQSIVVPAPAAAMSASCPTSGCTQTSLAQVCFDHYGIIHTIAASSAHYTNRSNHSSLAAACAAISTCGNGNNCVAIQNCLGTSSQPWTLWECVP